MFCLNFHVKSSYLDIDSCDTDRFDCEIDPGINFYNNVNLDCSYYTEQKFIHSISKKKGFSLIHFNARSLKSNFQSIQETLKNISYSFDVIAISETWLDENSDEDIFSIEGFKLYHTYRTHKKGGVVALFVNNQLKCKILTKHSVVEDNLYESVFVELIFEKSKNIVLGCIYRAPGSNLDLFNDKLSILMEEVINNNNKIVYICGDFNIDLIKGETHTGTKNFIDIMYGFGLFPLINKPSRITEFSQTLIDNIFTNNIETVNNSGLLINDITDHLPVFVKSDYFVFKTVFKKIKFYRDTSLHSLQLFQRALQDQNWDVVYNSNNVNSAYSNFIKLFTDIYNKYCPVKQRVIKGDNYSKPWFHKGLKNACVKKNQLYKNYLKHRTSESCEKYKKI